LDATELQLALEQRFSGRCPIEEDISKFC